MNFFSVESFCRDIQYSNDNHASERMVGNQSRLEFSSAIHRYYLQAMASIFGGVQFARIVVSFGFTISAGESEIHSWPRRSSGRLSHFTENESME